MDLWHWRDSFVPLCQWGICISLGWGILGEGMCRLMYYNWHLAWKRNFVWKQPLFALPNHVSLTRQCFWCALGTLLPVREESHVRIWVSPWVQFLGLYNIIVTGWFELGLWAPCLWMNCFLRRREKEGHVSEQNMCPWAQKTSAQPRSLPFKLSRREKNICS